MYGFRKHRSQATAQPSVGMTCSLKPALTLVKPSLLCHSSPAAHVIPAEVCAGAWNLWEAVQKTKTIMYGFRKHRSQATAQPSVGMTYPLKPTFSQQNPLYQLFTKEQSLFSPKTRSIQKFVVPLNREYHLVFAGFYYELMRIIPCL